MSAGIKKIPKKSIEEWLHQDVGVSSKNTSVSYVRGRKVGTHYSHWYTCDMKDSSVSPTKDKVFPFLNIEVYARLAYKNIVMMKYVITFTELYPEYSRYVKAYEFTHEVER